jgi:hypothetical protein
MDVFTAFSTGVIACILFAEIMWLFKLLLHPTNSKTDVAVLGFGMATGIFTLILVVRSVFI